MNPVATHFSNKATKSIALLILLSGLIACDTRAPGNPTTPHIPTDQGSQGDPIDPIDRTPVDEKDEYCYANNGAGAFCVKLKEPPSSYGYLLPTIENNFPSQRDAGPYYPPLNLMIKNSVPSDQYISKNFQWKEFFTADHEDLGMVQPILLESLQEMRSHIDRAILINSSYRSPAYNSTISGSAQWSRHMYGDAVDIKAPGVALEDLAKICEQFGASYTQLYVAHVHCDWRNSPKEPPLFPVFKSDQKSGDLPVFVPKISLQKSGKFLIASLENEPFKEDSGELVYKWSVKKMNSQQKAKSYNTSSIKWKPQAGIYLVEVTVGGSESAQIKYHFDPNN
ncbi:MAG: DUF882 domain-containing protein [Bdellovibrionales bacterium]|nr:DUF882 domain-containing protein [Bdellovibrionales bacterium]